jgi:dTDP-4-dehydrorhamnose 3,5-epimerase
MKFIPTGLAGACTVEIEKLEDERGFFGRAFCSDEFARNGLSSTFVQCNVSFNARKGTLRGMHFQEKPHEEAKLVRCTRGAIYDVIVDIRRASSTFGHWLGVELTADNLRMIYVPKGFAHGFQTLADDSEVLYQMSEFYHPDSARGVRWDDRTLAIRWPITYAVVSARDRTLPSLDEVLTS